MTLSLNLVSKQHDNMTGLCRSIQQLIHDALLLLKPFHTHGSLNIRILKVSCLPEILFSINRRQILTHFSHLFQAQALRGGTAVSTVTCIYHPSRPWFSLSEEIFRRNCCQGILLCPLCSCHVLLALPGAGPVVGSIPGVDGMVSLCLPCFLSDRVFLFHLDVEIDLLLFWTLGALAMTETTPSKRSLLDTYFV